MRAVLTVLLLVHGAIHVLGFVHWLKLTSVAQLSGRTLVPLSAAGSRAFALFWLLALVALIGAAALRLGSHDGWWMPALGGALLSQCLVVLAWHDAKFGTIANVLIFVAALVAAAQARFDASIDSEIRTLLERAAPAPGSVVERSELRDLPPPVRRWLETAGVVGRQRARTVRLRQRGELRTSPDGAWMPARAEQYFSVEPPAFVWKVAATMFFVLPVAGRDKYADGHGHMLIKAASLVNVVDAADEKIDRGSMLRFLGEIVWFPSAALSPFLAWEPIDGASARASMRHGGLVESAVFTINDEGRVSGLRAERYLGGGADAKLTPWIVSCTAWRAFLGIEVPTRGEVGWRLPSGDFPYYRWQILDVEQDGIAP